MKFSFKLLLWTLIVMAIGFGFSGYYYVNYVFRTAMDREIAQSLDENSILRFAFETAALNAPAKYDVLADATVGQIASSLETGGQGGGRMLRLSDRDKNILYSSDGFLADGRILDETAPGARTYRIIHPDAGYYIQTGTAVDVLNRKLYLETMRDVSEIFKDRDMGFSVYRSVTLAMLAFGTLVMSLISSWLTKPIRLLTRATKRMASGDYQYRAKKVSDDELGQLTVDFNRMSNALEDNISKLEEEIQAREDFVGAFAHELKTPLTSIIGYADMLRSHQLSGEQQFASANYIYTEGKRLEAMSFRLLDIIVTRRSRIRFQIVTADSLFDFLYDMYAVNRHLKVRFKYDRGRLRAEANLIKSVLINLLDNACKASEPGGLIMVYGRRMEDGYRFTVKDQGIGIPREEQQKITKAFYMVDKSRSRSRNGAGLGLALCEEILHLHDSRLEIQSEPGKGTSMSFFLPDEGKEEAV